MSELQDLVDAGLSQTEAAEYLRCSRTSVSRHARKEGVTFADGRRVQHHDLENYRAKAMTLPPTRARDFLLDLLDWLVIPSEAALQQTMDGLVLPPLLARLLHTFRMRQGQIVTIDVIMAALYGDRRDADWPDEQTGRVHVSRLRHALVVQGAPWKIVNVRNLGYRLVGSDDGKTNI